MYIIIGDYTILINLRLYNIGSNKLNIKYYIMYIIYS